MKETYDCVQVRRYAIVQHSNGIASNIEVLIMQRLVNITDELDTKDISMKTTYTLFISTMRG